MARRHPKKKQAKQQAEAEDDLSILHPDREIHVGGETVTVREYGFVEGLRIRAAAAPLIDELYQVMRGGDSDLDSIYALLAEHHRLLVELMAASIDQDLEFIQGLSDGDGSLLMDTWWVVNSAFFIRAVQRKMQVARVHGRTTATRSSAGGTSTPHSSPTDTPPTDSGDTPSDS
jgi:hypothetical protein